MYLSITSQFNISQLNTLKPGKTIQNGTRGWGWRAEGEGKIGGCVSQLSLFLINHNRATVLHTAGIFLGLQKLPDQITAYHSEIHKFCPATEMHSFMFPHGVSLDGQRKKIHLLSFFFFFSPLQPLLNLFPQRQKMSS